MIKESFALEKLDTKKLELQKLVAETQMVKNKVESHAAITIDDIERMENACEKWGDELKDFETQNTALDEEEIMRKKKEEDDKRNLAKEKQRQKENERKRKDDEKR